MIINIMDIKKEYFNYIHAFVNDLSSLNIDARIQISLKAVSFFLTTTKNIETIVYPMHKFIINSKSEIETENDIFLRNFEAKTGEIKTILNLIGGIWEEIENADKKIIWDWMRFFLEFSTANQNFLDK